MKSLLKNALLIPLFSVFVFESCSKKNSDTNTYAAPPPPPPTADTLSGKEFIFSDLTWDYWLDDFNELYITIENRPDLFSVDRIAELFVKSITDTAWVTAQRYNLNLSPGYVYSIYLRRLYVLPYPYIYSSSGNTQLAGSKVSLKVKFL